MCLCTYPIVAGVGMCNLNLGWELQYNVSGFGKKLLVVLSLHTSLWGFLYIVYIMLVIGDLVDW